VKSISGYVWNSIPVYANFTVIFFLVLWKTVNNKYICLLLFFSSAICGTVFCQFLEGDGNTYVEKLYYVHENSVHFCFQRMNECICQLKTKLGL
jgi:hypothetical protein